MRSSLVLALLGVVAAVAACSGNDPSPDDTTDAGTVLTDAGNTTTDAGSTTTDAGSTPTDAGEVDAGSPADAGSTPDAGETVDAGSPADAGPGPDPTARYVRGFNLNQVTFSISVTRNGNQVLSTTTLDKEHLSEYFPVPAGADLTLFDGNAPQQVPLAALPAGAKVTFIATLHGYRTLQETTAPGKRRFHLAVDDTAFTVKNDQDGSTLLTLSQFQSQGTFDLAEDATGFIGTGENPQHLSAGLVPLGEAGVFAYAFGASTEYLERLYHLVTPGLQTGVAPDASARFLGLSSRLANGAPVTVTALAGGRTITLASDAGLRSLTPFVWLPQPVTSFTATSANGTATVAGPVGVGVNIVAFDVGTTPTLQVIGNNTGIDTESAEKHVLFYNLQASGLRFSHPGPPLTWIPGARAGTPFPLLPTGRYENAFVRPGDVAFGISLTANDIATATITVTGISGNHDAFFHDDGSGKAALGVLYPDGTYRHFNAP